MRLNVTLREIRGKREVKEIAEASGVNPATIRQIEQGRLTPLDHQIPPLEQAYGVPITGWYSPLALLALQEDETE